MRQITRKLVMITAVSTAAILSGCSDKTPSESALKDQIVEGYSDCKPLSVEGFEKVNGFAQQDGSYVAQISYTLVMKPVAQNVRTVKDYLAQRDQLTSYLQDNQEKLSALRAKLDGMMAECNRTADAKRGTPNPDAEADNAAIAQIDSQISSYTGRIQEQKTKLAFAKNDAAYAASKGKPVPMAQLAADQQELDDLRAKRDAANATLEAAKQKLADDTNRASQVQQAATDDKKACTGEVDRIYRDNLDLFNGEKKLASLKTDALRTLKENLNQECQHLALGGVMAGILGADDDDVENYAKILKHQVSGTIRLRKSDKGWIIG